MSCHHPTQPWQQKNMSLVGTKDKQGLECLVARSPVAETAHVRAAHEQTLQRG